MKYILSIILFTAISSSATIKTIEGDYFIKINEPSEKTKLHQCHLIDTIYTEGQSMGIKSIGTIAFIPDHMQKVAGECGYVKPNGQYISVTDFSNLHNIIGCSYGCRKDQFAIPDVRGVFVRQ